MYYVHILCVHSDTDVPIKVTSISLDLDGCLSTRNNTSTAWFCCSALHQNVEKSMTRAVCHACRGELDSLGGKHSWFLFSLPAFRPAPKQTRSFKTQSELSISCSLTHTESSNLIHVHSAMSDHSDLWRQENKPTQEFSGGTLWFPLTSFHVDSFCRSVETSDTGSFIRFSMWQTSLLNSRKWKMSPLCWCCHRNQTHQIMQNYRWWDLWT